MDRKERRHSHANVNAFSSVIRDYFNAGQTYEVICDMQSDYHNIQ